MYLGRRKSLIHLLISPTLLLFSVIAADTALICRDPKTQFELFGRSRFRIVER